MLQYPEQMMAASLKACFYLAIKNFPESLPVRRHYGKFEIGHVGAAGSNMM